MHPQTLHLKNDQSLVIREASPEDARAILDYIKDVSEESDFLSFGAGEFHMPESNQVSVIENHAKAHNQVYLLGLIDNTIVSTLNFSAGRLPRLQHTGEFGMAVRQPYWGLGIGSLMLDTLIDWSQNTDVIKKINLRVRTDNQRAIAMYRHKGFVLEGTIRKEIFLDGKFYDHHWMGLEL
jgi:RimJ/RimL family protein N-acetyltransferase